MTIRLNDFGAFCVSFLVSSVMTLLGFKLWVAMLSAVVLTLTVATGIAYAQMICTTSYGVTTCTTPTTTVVCTTSYGITTCN